MGDFKRVLVPVLLAIALCPRAISPLQAQTSAAVPRLVNFSGKAIDALGRTTPGAAGATFSIYREQTGGAPLWIETQTVTADAKGNFTVQLGATQPEGLPLDLFTSGEARWLGVRINGGEEQPRVMLLSVPYALKAGDAATIGGLPPSAFALAAPLGSAQPAAANSNLGSAAPPVNPTVTGTGTVGSIPLWDSASDLTSSILTQTGSGSTARVGVNITTPSTTLDVKGTSNFRGTVTMPSAGLATSSAGKTSYPFVFATSAYNSSAKASLLQNFRWQAEPVNNNSSSASGTLNLLFSSGTGTPTETGLSIASNGQLSFATGQVFPGTGTITGVTAGTDLTGGGSTGPITLNIDTTKVPQLKAANTFTGNQTVNGNLTSTGVVTGSSYQIGSDLFGFGSKVNLVSFLGFSGSAASTGQFNTGVGAFSLGSNTTGTDNTAVGADALFFNLTGTDNTAVGFESLAYNTGSGMTAVGSQALEQNTIGTQSTAVGAGALEANTTGAGNSALGYVALINNTTGGGNTAIGWETLAYNTQGGGNTATGSDALIANTTGSGNTGTGTRALSANTYGEDNVAVGSGALQSNTTGNENTAVGTLALELSTTGNENTCVGYFCDMGTSDLRNATAIGARATVNVSNAVVLGSVAGINGAQATARVGIGTATPTAILTIGRGTGHPVSDSWETYSSRRWKTNIQTLPNALAKVEQLRGVTYDLKDSGKHEIGVIAEEVGAVVPELVSYEENGKDARGVDYSRLTALLIEGMKEQQREIQRLQYELRATRRSLKVQGHLPPTKPGLRMSAQVASTVTKTR
jgi:hypothetical protein